MLKLFFSKSLIYFTIVLCFETPSFGQEWEWLNPLPQGDKILQIHFTNESTGWLVPQSPNLFKTIDGGFTWDHIKINMTFKKISFLNDNLAWGIGNSYFANSKYGIYRTIDGGLTWDELIPDTTSFYSDIQFVNESQGWVIGLGGLWHTNDGGSTWIEQAKGQLHHGSAEYHLSFQDADYGWAGGWFGWSIKTADGGKTWTRDSTMAGYSKYVFIDSLFGWASSKTRSLAIKRTSDKGDTWYKTPQELFGVVFPFDDQRCLAAASDGIYRTVDAGTTWTKISSANYKYMLFHNENDGWGWQEIDPGFYRTSNGGVTWENQTFTVFGASGISLPAIDFVDVNTGWTLIRKFGKDGESSIAKTVDGGENWIVQKSNFPQEATALYFVDKDVGWIVGKNSMIQKTIDGGENWQAQYSDPISDLQDIIFIDKLTGWIVGSNGVISKTTDGGQAWTDVSPEINIYFKDVYFIDYSYGWVSGNWIYPNIGKTFLRTTDGGISWYDPIIDNTSNINFISFIDPAKGWARISNDTLTKSIIVTTTDSGKTWQEQFFVPFVGSNGSIRFADANHGWVVGFFGRILYTSNGGDTWIDQSGATTRWLNNIDFVNNQEAWIVGDYGSILRLTDGVNTHVLNFDKKKPLNIKEIDRLYQSYPNPINGVATIPYELHQGGKVIFELFDILGRKKREINLGWRGEGQHNIKIDTTDLSSAIYIYRLKTNRSVLVGKLSVVK